MMNIKALPQLEICRIQIFLKQTTKLYLIYNSIFKISSLIKELLVSLLQEEGHGLMEEEHKEMPINL